MIVYHFFYERLNETSSPIRAFYPVYSLVRAGRSAKLCPTRTKVCIAAIFIAEYSQEILTQICYQFLIFPSIAGAATNQKIR